MVSHITLDPGASIGEHRHEGDEEVYCILSGSGEYLEEGEWIAVRPGHITVALRGGTHALRNTGKEPLELLAVIAK
jgi:mannose-6-phosphate isomerase-like protein (cupin superfamily)